MIIYIYGHEFNYELEKLTRLFFPFERIDFKTNDSIETRNGLFALASVYKVDEDFEINAAAGLGDKIIEKNQSFSEAEVISGIVEKELEHSLAALLFDCYAELTGYKPQWGILTGIRPAKLYRRFEEMLGEKGTDSYFTGKFRVNDKKLSLLKRTAKSEEEIISRSGRGSVSIYISIPFCPSRCSYCSFVSHSIERAADLIPEYLRLLCKEIEYTADIVKRLELSVMTVYVGGGTPTTLSAEQLNMLLDTVHNCFGNEFDELTVEAGRPDTITKEKLLVLKKAGVDRISINPQTMNDNVLKAIGRRHTAKQTVDTFNLAREIGFSNINMDLIAGLPTDTSDSFADTLERVIALEPESVTVHSLSIKRSSAIKDNSASLMFEEGKMAGEMVDLAEERLSEKGILPYYMYRQSKTVGNLENVGYAKPGSEGLYNVYIMDETHTILACGASAVSKLKAEDDGKIERIFNFKYPYEYINKFDEIMKRKERIESFYYEHPISNK